MKPTVCTMGSAPSMSSHAASQSEQSNLKLPKTQNFDLSLFRRKKKDWKNWKITSRSRTSEVRKTRPQTANPALGKHRGSRRTIEQDSEISNESGVSTLQQAYRPLQRGEPYSFFSKVGGRRLFIKNPNKPDLKPKADNFSLKARVVAGDVNTRAVSAMNTVHIDREIDPNLFKFGKKSTSTNNIENQIKSHKYVMSIKNK